jgi:hypothetical protein
LRGPILKDPASASLNILDMPAGAAFNNVIAIMTFPKESMKSDEFVP